MTSKPEQAQIFPSCHTKVAYGSGIIWIVTILSDSAFWKLHVVFMVSSNSTSSFMANASVHLVSIKVRTLLGNPGAGLHYTHPILDSVSHSNTSPLSNLVSIKVRTLLGNPGAGLHYTHPILDSVSHSNTSPLSIELTLSIQDKYFSSYLEPMLLRFLPFFRGG